ncbi:MAG: hypothetical protein ACOCRX_05250 [Candidatus Woesearchaeota archaeon]
MSNIFSLGQNNLTVYINKLNHQNEELVKACEVGLLKIKQLEGLTKLNLKETKKIMEDALSLIEKHKKDR